jgi:NADH-quinone oxidoreductase subunit H
VSWEALLQIWLIHLKIIGIVAPVLIFVAYLTLAERKLMASLQRRKGPKAGLSVPLGSGHY